MQHLEEINPNAEKIKRQLQLILSSSEFKATQKQRSLLRFVVMETIEGRAQEIKGYTVATQVFGRSSDFDQATNPIVSIQAKNLRQALERYYLTAGRNDSIRIDIPKGTYVPTFHERTAEELNKINNAGEELNNRFEGSWPALVVRPFQNLTGNSQLNYLTIGLATELTTEITRYNDIKVLMCGPQGNGRRVSDSGARFVIDGNIRRDRSGIKITVQLIDLSTNVQVWSDTHQSNLEATQFISFQENVARMISAKIVGEFGVIAKTCSIESKNIPPSDLKTYEAILRYHEFNSNFTPDTFFNAFEALKIATDKEPECGLVWSMLARLYAANYSLELFDLETPLEDAISFAEKGVKLDPSNQRVRGIWAFVLLFKNELREAIVETERAIALNPNSLILMDSFGYLLTLMGDWDRGTALIKEAIRYNPFYNRIVHYALWVNWVRQKDYEQAYRETLNFNTPILFWEPLLKAAILGLLERIDEGKQAAEDLLRLKPDFPSRGTVLIRHYIKFKEIVERTIEGLNKVGLRIK